MIPTLCGRCLPEPSHPCQGTVIRTAVAVATSRKVLKKLHVLFYPPKELLPEQRAELEAFGPQVLWLGKQAQEEPEEKPATESKRKRPKAIPALSFLN